MPIPTPLYHAILHSGDGLKRPQHTGVIEYPISSWQHKGGGLGFVFSTQEEISQRSLSERTHADVCDAFSGL